MGTMKSCCVSVVVVGLMLPFKLPASPQRADPPPRASAKASFERGKQLLERGEYAQAAAAFQDVLKTVPDSPLLYNLLGFCLLRQGQQDRATDHFKKALALKPDYPAAHSNLGGIYLMQGRPEDAIAEFLAVINSDPKNAQAFSSLARAEMILGRKEAAIEHLRKAYELSPADASVGLALARLYLTTGQKALGQPIAHQLSKARPNDASLELELGNTLLDYELKEAAREHFRTALQADPKLQQVLYATATEHFKNQRYKQALTFLECMEPPTPNSSHWHGMVGYSRFKVGDSAGAVVELQKAMDADPENQDYVLELGEVFVANNNAAAAVTLLETASQAFSRSSQIWFGLGVAYLGDEKRALAERALRRCLELDPTLDLAYVVLGQSYKEGGEWNQLREVSQQLIELNPKNSVGYYHKALALQASSTRPRDETEVEQLLRKSLELNPDDPAPHYELAKLLVRQGKRDVSLLELEKIVHSWPDYAPAYYQLSRLYREKGETEKSAEAQKAHERIRQKERDTVMKRMIVEIRERPKRP